MAMYGAAVYLCHLLITTYVVTLCMCHLPVVHRWLYTMSPLSACWDVLLYNVTLCLFIFLRTTHHGILWLHYLFDILTQCTLCLHQHSDYRVRSCITSGSSYQWSGIMRHSVYLLDSKLCPCHLLINDVRHYAVSRSSPWWTHTILHSIFIIFLMTTFDPRLCAISLMTMLDASLCLHHLCDNHTWHYVCVTSCECVSCCCMTVSFPWQHEQASTLSHLSDNHIWCSTYV